MSEVREVAIPVNGERLVADHVSGRGFAVVWVHGFGSHRGGEKAAAVRDECVRRGWAFTAADLRGHGATGGPMRELTAPRLLEDVAAVVEFVRGEGFERVGLVGSSMGGFAAAWFAKRHPEQVAGCVLLAPAFHFLDRRWNLLTEAEREEWARAGVRRMRNEWVDVEVGYGLMADRERFALKELAADWRTPTLIYHGCADDVVPDQDSLEFLRRVEFDDVELRLLKGGDHRLTAHKDAIAGAAGRFFGRLM